MQIALSRPSLVMYGATQRSPVEKIHPKIQSALDCTDRFFIIYSPQPRGASPSPKGPPMSQQPMPIALT